MIPAATESQVCRKNWLNLFQFVPKKKAKRSRDLLQKHCDAHIILWVTSASCVATSGTARYNSGSPCTRFSNILTLGELWDSIRNSFHSSFAGAVPETWNSAKMSRNSLNRCTEWWWVYGMVTAKSDNMFELNLIHRDTDVGWAGRCGICRNLKRPKRLFHSLQIRQWIEN